MPSNPLVAIKENINEKTRTGVSNSWKSHHKSNKLILILALGGVFVLMVGVLFAFQKKSTSFTPKVTGGPSLKADKEKVDLGDLKLGNPVQVSFELKNTGDQPLVFCKTPYIEVKKGCCPPPVTIGSMILQPGETTTLSTEFLMHGNMGGYHDFSVHIPNNDPNNKDRIVTILSNWVN